MTTEKTKQYAEATRASNPSKSEREKFNEMASKIKESISHSVLEKLGFVKREIITDVIGATIDDFYAVVIDAACDDEFVAFAKRIKTNLKTDAQAAERRSPVGSRTERKTACGA